MPSKEAYEVDDVLLSRIQGSNIGTDLREPPLYALKAVPSSDVINAKVHFSKALPSFVVAENILLYGASL